MKKIHLIKLNQIKENPSNPRTMNKDKFDKLLASIKEFPKMLEIRPIVINKDNIVLGGNMRLKACNKLGLNEVPVIYADDLTDAEQRQFIIKDNVGFGDWDWELLANEWDSADLEDWGLTVPDFFDMPEGDDLVEEEENNPAVMKITFDNVDQMQQAEIDIQELIDRKYEGAYYSVKAGEL